MRQIKKSAAGRDNLSLDLSRFQTVFDDRFSNDKTLDKSLWSDSWGNADQYNFSGGALTLVGYQDPWWQPVGFMQHATGKTAGEGYGLFQFSGYGNPGQGIGICFIMWRADNLFLDSSTPGKATEIDILESWDKSKSVESTIHYYDSGSAQNNGQAFHNLAIDPTKPHTYAMDWERGSLTFYIDGVEMYRDTTHVPLDAADGGSNEVMGAQVINEAHLVTTPTVELHITDMSYSAPVGATPPPTPVQNPVTLGGGTQSYAAAAGATVQAGSGSDTITTASGPVSVTGSSGLLTFLGGAGSSTVSGAAGSATMSGGSGGGVYTGGSAGLNLLVSRGASGSNTTLTGGGAGDRLFGSASGNDVLSAGPGRASILGGGGNTTITGGAAASSVIFTGNGTSAVTGGAAGGDTVVGGAGSLSVAANKGDAIFGNAGALNVTGSTTGADSIAGGAGALTVNGQGGNMLVVAGSTTSAINVGNGASLVFAGSGSTSVTGGAGSMEVVLGSGQVTAGEGSGAAVFDVVKGSAGGTDVLSGFRPGTDTIKLYGYQAADQQVGSSGGSTLISLSDGTKIQLVGVSDPGGSIIG